MESSIEGLSAMQPKVRPNNPRNRLRRDMVTDDPVYSLFVSGSSTGCPWSFYCMICHRNVSMKTRGAGELDRLFGTPKHWNADLTYRVHNGLPVYNRLRDPMVLSAEQEADFLSRVCRGRAEGFSFPEELLPSCTREGSSVPLLTMVTSLMELLRYGGSYLLLRKHWGCFWATLGRENPLYSLTWSRSESLVSRFVLLNDMCTVSTLRVLSYSCYLDWS